MSEKLLNLLGLMRRAKAVEIGETNSGNACHEGKAKLLLLAQDASDNARRRAESFVNGRKTVLITVPFKKDEISGHVGVSGCSMLAITDLGFANAFLQGLSTKDPEKYTEYADYIKGRLDRCAKRKRETGTNRKNVINGKRED